MKAAHAITVNYTASVTSYWAENGLQRLHVAIWPKIGPGRDDHIINDLAAANKHHIENGLKIGGLLGKLYEMRLS